MTSALNTARTELTRDNPATRKVAILITDGRPSSTGGASSAATNLKNAGVELFTIGLGSGVNNNFLKTVASKVEYHYEAPPASDIERFIAPLVKSF